MENDILCCYFNDDVVSIKYFCVVFMNEGICFC